MFLKRQEKEPIIDNEIRLHFSFLFGNKDISELPVSSPLDIFGIRVFGILEDKVLSAIRKKQGSAFRLGAKSFIPEAIQGIPLPKTIILTQNLIAKVLRFTKQTPKRFSRNYFRDCLLVGEEIGGFLIKEHLTNDFHSQSAPDIVGVDTTLYLAGVIDRYGKPSSIILFSPFQPKRRLINLPTANRLQLNLNPA